MSTDDAWAIRQPVAGEYITTGAPRGQRENNRVAWLTAAVLFIAAGLAELAALLARTQLGPTTQPLYESAGTIVGQGIKAAVLVGCGALLRNRKTRDAACGLALGLVLIVDTNYFWKLRPSRLSREYDALGIWLSLAVLVLQTAGALVVLVLVVRQRAHRRGRQRRVDRVVAVLLGFIGAVLWVASNVLASYRLGVGTIFGGVQHSETCCSWAQNDGWNHLAVVLGGIAMIALALVAATVRAKARAAGFLFGMALVAFADVAVSVVSSLAPEPTFLGFHHRQLVGPSVIVTFTPTAGFWVELFAMLLLGAAGAFRLLLGPRMDRYRVSELTGSAPLSRRPGMPGT